MAIGMRRLGMALFGAGGALLAPGAGAQDIRVEQVVGGLSAPVAAVAAPGEPGRLYVVEQNGVIRVLELGPGTVRPTPLLDIGPNGAGLTLGSGERGLLGLAFHPDFQSNGRFYVNYTSASTSPLTSRIAQFTDADHDGVADSTTPVVLRTIVQPFSNHNGGDLHFGPDGMLYAGLGDGGSFNDPNELAQNRQSLLGKMLRLDVDGAPTYVPADNPFVGDPSTLDEIWALGLRNPWRFSFDRLSGDLWIGDVGQDAREEIDFQPALLPDGSNIGDVGGRNYAWDCREGLIASPFTDDDCSELGTYTDPVIDVAHGSEGGCSITGGVVYRGAAIPQLNGTYFYADYCGGWVRSFRYAGGAVTEQRDWTELFALGNGVVAFGEDLDGEVYLVDLGGTISKIVPNDTACGCPCVLQGNEGLVFEDTFATDLGWTVVDGGATDGQWERAMPVDDPGYAHDPPTDADGTSGFCYLTDNAAGNSDVDGGETILVSPPLDLTAGAITICYQYFLRLTVADGFDGIRVEISGNADAGPWSLVSEHTDDNGLFWTRHAITQADLDAAGVTLTSDMRLRFRAGDLDAASIVEAGLDNVRVYSGNIPDCNANGVDDAIDIAAGTSEDCNGNSIPDECDIASGLEEDCAGGILGAFEEGEPFFDASCIGCHGAAGLGGTGPNIRNVSRTTIKARLTFQVFHPGGQFQNATDADFANLEAYLADGSSRARPDGVPDTCQAGLPDCDNDTLPDACELEQGFQQDLNYDGTPDNCQPFCPGDLDADGVTNIFDFAALAANFASGPPARFSQGDLNGDGVVDVFDFGILAANFGCDVTGP